MQPLILNYQKRNVWYNINHYEINEALISLIQNLQFAILHYDTYENGAYNENIHS